MPYNGSGVFSLVAGNPVVTGTIISSTWANNTLSDIANNGLTNALTKDGQQTPTGNIPFGGFRATGLGDAVNLQDATTAKQIQNGGLVTLAAVAGTDTITATTSPGITAYAAGQSFRFVAAGANTTGIPTLNINALGAKNITRNGTAGIVPGDIRSGSVVTVTYDGTQFQITGIIGAGGVVSVSRNANSLLVTQGPTIPFTADEVILQDALGGVQYKFKSVSLNNNISTVGVINGFDTGTATANGFAALYLMYNPTTGVLGTLSTLATSIKAPEIYAGGAAPSGFTVSALIAVLPIGTANFTYAAYALTDRHVDFNGANLITGSGFTGGPSAVTSAQIPLNARTVYGTSQFGSTAASSVSAAIGPTSAAAVGVSTSAFTFTAAGSLAVPYKSAVLTPQTVYRTNANTAGTPSFTIGLNGYDF
jgi:hypothetical protein